MPIQTFAASIGEHAAFNASPNTVPVIGENVSGWQVDSQGQPFQYKIIHNLNLANPGKLIVQLSNIHSDSINPPDSIHARVLPGYANYFVVQGYGLRPNAPKPIAEYEHSCGFSFVAELFD